MRSTLHIAAGVEAAVAAGRPVVALESTVFSRLGLPYPTGAEALRRSVEAVTAGGALPALTAVLDGVARVGLDDAEFDAVVGASRKAGERDLPVAVAQRWPAAGTTVSASVALAAAAGIAVFATGAIGGVHRDWARTGDESADLPALARHPVVTVCAGAKSFLDLSRTLERLETLGVPVIGLDTDEFPAFYSRRSGLPVPHQVASAEEAAEVVTAARSLGYGGGLLLVAPVPEADEVPFEEVEPIVVSALAEAAAAGVTGGAVTPFVLDRVADGTAGRSVRANVALVEDNARWAAALAGALAAAAGR
ncbi:MAG: pseudouridine-5'-phosphate glycosidase [Actinomycetota bacterium]|nr:pseudouridine-5'-phosphate glycosidase [Actinomycetota bacterium]